MLLALALFTTGAATLHAQQAGDIAIVGFNADNPDAFAFVALAPLTGGTTIHFTDNGWRAAGGFRANEGTFSYTVPAGGLTPGMVVSVTDPAGPSFSASGDQLLAYTGSEDNPSFVYGLNVEGTGWQADATSSNTSALPPGLVNGMTAVAVAEVDNVAYVGRTTGSRSELLTAIGDPANWSGSNSTAQAFPTSFIVDGAPGGGNQAPRFTVALTNRTLVADARLSFTYQASDPESASLTYALIDGPGTINATSGTYTWVPTTSDIGQSFTVTVTASDGELTAQTSATLTIVGEAPTGTLFPGLSGSALRDAVASAYTPDQTLGYNRGRDTLYAVVEASANGAVAGIYTGFSVQLDPSADPSSHLFANGINAEHTWPQSLGASSEPQRSDMHILYPSRANVNSARGNNPYGVLTNAEAVRWYRDAQSQSTPPADRGSWSISGDNAFEPRDAVKGDVARAIFYYATIYGGLTSSFFEGQAETLLAWNAADPPSSQEVERSSRIAVHQGNVNPFVVDPTLMNRIRGLVANQPPVFSAVLADQTLDAEAPFAFQYTASDPNGDAVTYSLVNGPGTINAVSGQYMWPPSASDAGQSFGVTVSANDGQASATTSATLTVQAVANSAPVFLTALTDQAVAVGQPFAFQYTASDPDGDPLTYSLLEGPGSLDANGRFTWTPTLSEANTTFTIRVSVSDGQRSTPTVAMLSVTPPSIIYGDVSDDGQLGADDASLILLAVATGTPPDTATALRADVSGNGQVTAYDAALLLQYLAGLIDCFPATAGCNATAPLRAPTSVR